jgi:hypothetical protein
MPSLRAPLLCSLILVGAIPSSAAAQATVDWYTETGGGGALARPAGESKNGGALAPPTAVGSVEGPQSDISATPPISSPAQAAPEPSRAPEARATAPDEQPAARPAQAAPTVTGGEDQASPEAGPIGALPLTGLELAAVVGAGLCLVIAGAALRPRRRIA